MLEPVGDRLIVIEKSKPKEEKTQSGIIIPTTNNQHQQLKEAVVIKSNNNEFKENDVVIYTATAGVNLPFENKLYTILHVEEVIAKYTNEEEN